MELCSFNVSNNDPFFLIAGPCVIENEATALETAEQLQETASSLAITSPLSKGEISGPRPIAGC